MRIRRSLLTFAVTLLGHCSRGHLAVVEVADTIKPTVTASSCSSAAGPCFLTRPASREGFAGDQPELSARPGRSHHLDGPMTDAVIIVGLRDAAPSRHMRESGGYLRAPSLRSRFGKQLRQTSGVAITAEFGAAERLIH